jgi:translation elongation factor EF-1alpha
MGTVPPDWAAAGHCVWGTFSTYHDGELVSHLRQTHVSAPGCIAPVITVSGPRQVQRGGSPAAHQHRDQGLCHAEAVTVRQVQRSGDRYEQQRQDNHTGTASWATAR